MADNRPPRNSALPFPPDRDPGVTLTDSVSSGAFAADRFVIQRRLGKGGFGVVDQAYDRWRGTEVALKSLHRVDAASIYDFKKEFRTLADLSHPNLVSFYDLVGEGDQWFIAMELVRGTDFVRYVSSDPETGDASAADLS